MMPRFTPTIDLGTVVSISVTLILALYAHYRATISKIEDSVKTTDDKLNTAVRETDEKIAGLDNRVVALETTVGISRGAA